MAGEESLNAPRVTDHSTVALRAAPRESGGVSPTSAATNANTKLLRVILARKVASQRAVGQPLLRLCYRTCNSMLSLWLLNSGAYMHWISATPVWYWPRNWTRVEYSKTYVPLGR